MAVTRINNNQISDASAGNTYVGINAAVKLQAYSVTATRIANNLTYGSDLTITGNLTVQGNTTTIDTTYTTIEDPVLLLASNQTGAPSVDIGFVGERGTSQNIAFVWDESVGEFVTVYTTTGETNTTVSIASYADLHIGNGNIGGNAVINGTTSLVGNLIGTVNATGNINGGNLNAVAIVNAPSHIGTIVSVTGNVTGGNIVTSGQVSSTGNITTLANVNAGNLNISGSQTISGNINAGNLNATNAVTAATGFFSGNVTVVGTLTSTSNIIANVSGIFFGDAVTGNNAILAGVPAFTSLGSNVVAQFSGNVNSYSQINFENINSGNRASTDYIATADNGNDVANYVNMGIASSTYNYPEFSAFGPNDAYLHNNGGNLLINNETPGKIIKFVVGGSTSTDLIATLSNTQFSMTGDISATGNVTGSNVNTAGLVSATGNLIGGNVSTAGLVTATGNVNTSAGVLATGNIRGGNILTPGLISATGNITSAANISGGNISTTGSFTAASLSATGNITGGNLVTGGLITATGNITSTANVAGGNVIATTTVSAPSHIGTIVSVTGNVTGGNLLTGGLISATGGITSAANIAGGNLSVTGAVNAATMSATGNLFVGGNLTVQGNITYQNVDDLRVEDPVIIMGTGPNGAPLTADDGMDRGIYMEYYKSGALGNAFVGWDNSTGNMIAATSVNFSANNVVNVLSYGTFQTGNIFAQSAVSTGNITGGNLLTSGLISATGNITSAANIAGGNISTTGSFTAASLSVSGNVTGGNLVTSGQVTATGNITSTANVAGGNIVTAGQVTATGNVSGGNLNVTGNIVDTGPLSIITAASGNITLAPNGTSVVIVTTTGANISGTASVSGNVTGGNIITGGLVTATGNLNTSAGVAATGNISGGNLLTGGVITSTGNITGGNIVTGGQVTATGNITSAANVAGGNVIATTTVSAPSHIGTIVSVTGNVTGGNIVTGGLITATGNITSTANVAGGNVIATTTVSAPSHIGTIVSVTGNVTGGNINTAGLVSATGNINGGNVNTTSVIGTVVSMSGNITGANLNTGGSNGLTLNGANINANAGRITINSNDNDVDFAVDGDTVANVFYIDAGTGTASFGSSTQTTNAVVAFNATNSILMPVGNTLQRPGTAVTGMLRFNSTLDAVEVYDSSSWSTVGTPTFTVITDDQFTGNGAQTVYTLANAYTTNAVIVSINGVVQIPTSAYSMTGNVLTFTEAPQSGDFIDVRGITTTTQVTSISNSPGTAIVQPNTTLAQVDITGNLIPSADITYNLGSPSARWNELFLAGNTITLGNTVLKNTSGNTIGFFGPDGTTPATIAASSVDTTVIANGTSNVAVASSGGNVRVNVGGTSNVMVVSSTGAAIIGDLSVTGNATLSGNILGDRIQNGTTQIDIQTPSGNANVTVAGTSNVAVFATTGVFVTGVASATGNVTGSNIVTGGQVTATGNVSGGNLNVTGNIVDSAALEIITGSNGNITLSPNGSGLIVANKDIRNGQANGVGNIGAVGGFFNTIFAKATSAQYADLAENYCADAEYAPGTVLSFGGEHEVTVSTAEGDRRIAGVVSTNPSYIMNSTLECEFVATVALTGRVPTLVTGPVAKGDMMVSAGNGRAMACTTPAIGTVIGKALENHAGGDGVIEVVVGRL